MEAGLKFRRVKQRNQGDPGGDEVDDLYQVEEELSDGCRYQALSSHCLVIHR